ncbi:hypothetical protein [Actinoplanes sp. NPDC020271]
MRRSVLDAASAQARVNGKLDEFIIDMDTAIMRTIYPKSTT